MSKKATNKILTGLKQSAEYVRVRGVILDWIREDVSIAAKMKMTPEHINKLTDRICGSRTI